jgi:uncharacterized protein YndB with AHSA1/START domain
MIDDVDEAEQTTGTRLHLEKILAVLPERVFAAFVDAEQLRRWWGVPDSPFRAFSLMRSREGITGF